MSGQQAQPSGLDQRIDAFEQRVVGRSIAANSWPLYRSWIRNFERWCHQEGISDPDIGDVEAFDNFLADESRTAYPWDNGQGRPAPHEYAYSSRITAISAVKKWIRREYGRRIPEAPGDIAIGEPEPFDPTYLAPMEVDKIYDDADDACDLDGCEAALRLSYDAILRASELVRVSRSDVDLDAGEVYVRATKGSQNMTVGLTDPTVEALTDHIAAHPNRDRLFRNAYDRAWRPSAWSTHVLRKHCDDGAHALGRHTPIMHRLEGADPPFMQQDYTGEDFGDVYQRARHRNPSMTSKYARVVGINVPKWASSS